jgi:hypothetical protein
MRGHKCLYFVPSFQEICAIDVEFIGQMLGRRTLGDATQDLDDRGTAIAGLPPNRGGEQVEDRAALSTAGIRNERSPPPMGRLLSAERMAARTV